MKTKRNTGSQVVYWSDEDKCYIGVCPSLFGGGVHGDDEIAVRKELRQVIAEWKAYDRKAAGGR